MLLTSAILTVTLEDSWNTGYARGCASFQPQHLYTSFKRISMTTRFQFSEFWPNCADALVETLWISIHYREQP